MKILGIDPGFGRVGVAVVEKLSPEIGSLGPSDPISGAREVLLYSGCIETNKDDSAADRINEITNTIGDVIKEYKPDHLAIEKLFFTNNQKTAMAVSEARGAIIDKANHLGLEIFEYTPLQIKVAVTGFGKASKKQVAEMTERLIKISKKPEHDDEYDAIATALTHCASHRQ